MFSKKRDDPQEPEKSNPLVYLSGPFIPQPPFRAMHVMVRSAAEFYRHGDKKAAEFTLDALVNYITDFKAHQEMVSEGEFNIDGAKVAQVFQRYAEKEIKKSRPSFGKRPKKKNK